MTYRQRSRNLTPEQQAKSDARRAQFRELAQKIGAMSPDQQAEMAAKMAGTVTIEGRVLSIHNACLLACQLPSATMVGGFQQWKRAGRQVRKGEHGLMIWAPTGPGERQLIDDAAAAGEVKARPGFIMVTVFDVSQTDAVSEAPHSIFCRLCLVDHMSDESCDSIPRPGGAA